MVQVGTMVWLASELMFFGGLFAMYFTLRSTSPELWAEHTAILNVPLAAVNTVILVLSSVTAQFGVLAAGLDLTLPEPPLLLTPDRHVSA